jgi:putative transposase
MGHTYVSSCFHCIFSTKDRRDYICPDLQGRLWPYMGGIARQNDMQALCVGGIANHAHLLLMIPARISVAKAVQLIKGGSSKWIRDTFPAQHAFGWQDGYGAFSVSLSLAPKVVEYIHNQAQHHRTRTFEEEFVAFLERHNIAYDPQYVFG